MKRPIVFSQTVQVLVRSCCAVLAVCAAAVSAHALNTEQLTPEELAIHDTTLQALAPLIEAKRASGEANLLTWEELYAPLEAGQRAYLDAYRELRAEDLGATSHFFGEAADPDLVPVGPQFISLEGRPERLDPQYLPRPVLAAYERMLHAMHLDLDKGLLVESGYRSPAYQLYLFLYFMSNHDFSIERTNRFNALPGYSEHGYPDRQAIDFINEEGINGEYDTDAFVALPEYEWLQEHAAEYGFHLSYPPDNPYNTAFEPWHWHYNAE